MIDKLIQSAWNWMEPKVPGAQGILNKAMEAAKTSASPGAVMDALNGIAQVNGWDNKLKSAQFYPLYESLRNKSSDEIIPYGIKALKELGLFNVISAFFGGAKR